MIVIAGGILAGVGTWAFWSDTDSSTGNTVEAGTMDLAINGSANGTTEDFNLINAQPGDQVNHTYALTNEGSTEADHLEIGFNYTENDLRAEPNDSELANELNASETASLIRVQTMQYESPQGTVLDDITSNVTDTNGNGYVDLQEVNAQTNVLDDLQAPAPNSSSTTYFTLDLEVANDNAAYWTGADTTGNLTGADEDVMADGVDIAVNFTLNQDSSQ
ncbi:TasA family protein [Haladaptatus sp. R4]|uniref:TasA family protein n=1 Tax=Haladaptatus sp. R4 TaxID=1679489 RepID=UPI0031831914